MTVVVVQSTSHDPGISYPGWNSILGGHWFESRQFSAFFGLNNQSRRSRWCHNPLKYREKVPLPKDIKIQKLWIVGKAQNLMIDMGTWLNKQTGADSNYLWRKRPLGHCSSSRNDNTAWETTFRHYVVNSLKFHSSCWCYQDQSKCVSSHMIFSGLTHLHA